MNLRQLRTLATFLDKGSFSAVGDRVGLSHSAVSVQVRQLETELGVLLFDRSVKPPLFTPVGAQIATLSRDVLARVATIRRVAAGEHTPASISIGVVPTALQHLLPAFLDCLRQCYPTLQLKVRSGFSGELAASVSNGMMDVAILTLPVEQIEGLEVTDIASEPLYVIAPRNADVAGTDADLVRSLPFIAFNKKSWLGQQIDARLQVRGIHVNDIMEVDSLDAIEKLVEAAFGVSIVPQRVLAQPLSDRLRCIPFCTPIEVRKLVLVQNATSAGQVFGRSIQAMVRALAGPDDGGTVLAKADIV